MIHVQLCVCERERIRESGRGWEQVRDTSLSHRWPVSLVLTRPDIQTYNVSTYSPPYTHTHTQLSAQPSPFPSPPRCQAAGGAIQYTSCVRSCPVPTAQTSRSARTRRLIKQHKFDLEQGRCWPSNWFYNQELYSMISRSEVCTSSWHFREKTADR